jgi:hypothetical protein
MTTAPIEPVPIQEFETWMFGPNEPIDLHRVSFDRKTVDFFFCMLLLHSVRAKARAHITSAVKADSEIQTNLGLIAGHQGLRDDTG